MDLPEQIKEYFAKWTKLKVIIHDSKTTNRYFREREIWWASLGANIGFEQDGKNENYERPILIFKKFNKDMLWALPLTSKEKVGNKYYLETKHNDKKYFIILSQLRLISSKRLIRNIRKIPQEEFIEVRRRIKELL